MTLDKAIEILVFETGDAMVRPHLLEAMKLGIKALERFRSMREAGQYVGMPRLKGETEEKGVT